MEILGKMIHPTCGSDLRRSTKIVAMIDSILCGFSIFSAIAVIIGLTLTVKDPVTSSWPIGCVLLHMILITMVIYLDFRLYRAAHERDVLKLRVWKKAVGAVLILATAFVLLVHHTADRTDPGSRYPLLWFYVVYLITAVFRSYMFWVVYTFIREFQLIEIDI